MRDALADFGALSLATKDVAVYGADQLDLATIDSNFRYSQHQPGGNGLCVVFVPATDFSTVDGIIPFIEGDGDSAFGSATTLVTGEQRTAPDAGDRIVLPLPPRCERFIRVGATPKSSGTFTAETVYAYLEHGVNPQ